MIGDGLVMTSFNCFPIYVVGIHYASYSVKRELAARNCMIGDGLVLKISDFGLSREKVVHTMSDRNKPILWKWSAPEVLLHGMKRK